MSFDGLRSSAAGKGVSMAVVTISRQYGSSGGEIARKVAVDLGWRFVDKRDMGRILSDYGLVGFGGDYESKIGFWAVFDSRLRTTVTMLNRAMLAVARLGDAVILGRGAFAVFAGYSDVLNVRIQAPFSVRADRVLAEGLAGGLEMAQATVRKGDEVRRVFVESMYGVRWDNPEAYDLLIDTGKIRPEAAAELIVHTVKSMGSGFLGGEAVPGGRTTASIPIDKILEESILRL